MLEWRDLEYRVMHLEDDEAFEDLLNEYSRRDWIVLEVGRSVFRTPFTDSDNPKTCCEWYCVLGKERGQVKPLHRSKGFPGVPKEE